MIGRYGGGHRLDPARVPYARVRDATGESQGIGVRVVVDQRQGFAYAGSLDPDVIAEVLDEARDNASFATPDEFLGLAEPDGVAVAERIATLPDAPPVILISSYADAAVDPRVRSAEVRGFLHKQDLTCDAIMALLA